MNKKTHDNTLRSAVKLGMYFMTKKIAEVINEMDFDKAVDEVMGEIIKKDRENKMGYNPYQE